MYCSNCGVDLVNAPKFCFKCGQIIPHEGESKSDKDTDEVSSVATKNECEKISRHGTKWLTFWNYVSLPLGGLLGLLMSLRLGNFGIIVFLLSLLQFFVAYGLHRRKLQGWQLNWLLIVMIYLNMAIPIPGTNIKLNLMVQFLIKAFVGGLIWMWPNYTYWKKRKVLFQ